MFYKLLKLRAATPLPSRGGAGVGSVTISTEGTQTISNSLEVRDPTPTPPLEGRGKATGRRPQVGNVPCGIID